MYITSENYVSTLHTLICSREARKRYLFDAKNTRLLLDVGCICTIDKRLVRKAYGNIYDRTVVSEGNSLNDREQSIGSQSVSIPSLHVLHATHRSIRHAHAHEHERASAQSRSVPHPSPSSRESGSSGTDGGDSRVSTTRADSSPPSFQILR